MSEMKKLQRRTLKAVLEFCPFSVCNRGQSPHKNTVRISSANVPYVAKSVPLMMDVISGKIYGDLKKHHIMNTHFIEENKECKTNTQVS